MDGVCRYVGRRRSRCTMGRVVTVWDAICLVRSVDRLRQRGLDRAIGRQLLDAGVAAGGLEMARDLLAGGDDLIAAVNAASAEAGMTSATGPHEFNPDWTLAPAALLREWMTGNDRTLGGLATALAASGLASENEARIAVQEVLDRSPLVELHAAMLDCCTGIPARTWLNWESGYRTDLAAGRTDTTPDEG